MLKQDEVHFFGNINLKALIKKDGKILLAQYPNSDKRVAGKWDMPGGRLNEGESVLDGLKREVREEIGAEIVVGKIIATGTFLNVNGVKNFFVIHESTLANDDRPFIFEEEEVADARWVSANEFFTLPILYPEYQEALRSILV
ncbi:MAG: NUDIX domain-containing protein [Patescibacteria group bacterium]